jgi:hypothetical protein
MKLLAAAKPEILTGEVRCGQHWRQGPSAPGGDTSWCKLPANHKGACARGKLGDNIVIQGKYDYEGNPQKDEWVRRAYGGANSSSARHSAQSMFDYLREMMPEYSWDDEEAQFRYDGGGFRGPPHYTEAGYEKAYDVHIDYSAGKDFAVYTVEHPDTHEILDISEEDFMTIYKACTIGPTHLDTGKYAKIAREVLKKYA